MEDVGTACISSDGGNSKCHTTHCLKYKVVLGKKILKCFHSKPPMSDNECILLLKSLLNFEEYLLWKNYQLEWQTF